ncbi:MAG: phage recombination protein Bet [Desulfurellales bacterium]|nr:MAG: phage recombination protein Bet [Desulfurellales bacterium]
MNAPEMLDQGMPELPHEEAFPIFRKPLDEQFALLTNSLYPGASRDAIAQVISYCWSLKLDPMTKPVHIVPMWDSKDRCSYDVIMPGVGLYRTIAARTRQYAGMSEPVFGPTLKRTIGNVEIEYPEWCSITVYRQLDSGYVAEFPAVERWVENYAIKGGKDRDQSPNAMWSKRVFGQLAKCAEAQALRKAFPEVGAAPTMEEMQGRDYQEYVGRTIDNESGDVVQPGIKTPQRKQQAGPAPEPAAEQPVRDQQAQHAAEVMTQVSATIDEINQSKNAAPAPEPTAAAAPAPEPTAAAPNDLPATVGQINWLRKKIEAANIRPDDIRAKFNIATLNGISIAKWDAIKRYVTGTVAA